MNTRPILPAPAEAITLEQAKQQCRFDSSEEDALFTDFLIPAAREECEQILKRSIMLTTRLATLDAFPACPLTLPWPSLQEVTSVEYRNPAGAWVTLAPAAYTVATAASSVSPVVGTSWPATSAEPESVRITYKSGFGAGSAEEQRAAVPAAVRRWMLLRISTAWVHRDEIVAGIASELPGRHAEGILDGAKMWEF